MKAKYFSMVTMAIVAASMLAACGEKVPDDPYTTVTLNEVTRSTVVSKGFKYKLVNPQIVALNRNLGLIREGDNLEIISARSLEDKIMPHMGGDFSLNVIKRFSPYVYFKVDEIVTDVDTIMTNQRGAIAYPVITSVEEFGATEEAYPNHDVDVYRWDRTQTLKDMESKKVRVQGHFVVEKEEGKDILYLIGSSAKLKVAEGTSDGMGLILNYLMDNNYEFDGGITLMEINEFANRRKDHVAGTIEINFIMFNDQLITG